MEKEANDNEDLPDHNTKTELFNVFLLGLCFCLVMGGFNTMGQTQALIYNSVAETGENPGFEVNGLIINGIVYGVFALASWLSPSIVLKLGPRLSMMLAGLTYLFNIIQLLYINKVSIYVASAVLGMGAPILWTAQGTFLSNNSDARTVTRNFGVFWAMNTSSTFIGNLFAYYLFKDQELIDQNKRMTLGYALTAVSGVGVSLMYFLRPTPWVKQHSMDSMVTTFKDTVKLFLTRDMLMLSLTLFYTGLHQTLWGGVYSTSIGFTKGFGEERKSLATLSGVIVGMGEVLGGILFAFMGQWTVKRGRDPIVMLGFVLSMIAYFFMFLNIPASAPLEEADPLEYGYIKPNKHLALFTSFLLGFSDACFMTQVQSILGGTFRDQAASAFGIYKFVQSLASCIGFSYSSFVELHWQLLIVICFDILGTLAAVKMEMDSRGKWWSLENEDDKE